MIIMSMALMLCISCAMPTAFAADSTEESDIDPVIQIEFDDYVSSKEYYRTLLEEGYTLIIHVGEENEAAGLAEFSCNDDANADVDQNEPTIVPYGDSAPYYGWDVSHSPSAINGKDLHLTGPLYTNYYYTGCSVYELDLYNYNDKKVKWELVSKKDLSTFKTFEIAPDSAIVKLVYEPSWFGRFYRPCNVQGTVFKYVMH